MIRAERRYASPTARKPRASGDDPEDYAEMGGYMG